MFYRLTYPLLLLTIIVFFGSQSLIAQNEFTGYYRFESGLLLNKSSDFLFNRHIIQPTFESRSNLYSVKVTGQLRQSLTNTSVESLDFRLREAKIDILFEDFDVTIGQQFIAWGRADATQIHDIISPMDLSEFLTQDFSDLRQGITAVNFQYYITNNSFQFIAIPTFVSSILPNPESRWSYFPNQSTNYLPEKDRPKRLRDTQFALRWNNRSSIKLDFDLSLYSGFNPQPALRKSISTFTVPIILDVIPEYQRGNAVMLGAEYRFNNSMSFLMEHAYWSNRSFDLIPEELRSSNPDPSALIPILLATQENDFLSSSPLLESMLGIKFTAADISVRMQYVGNYITKHNNSLLQDKFYHFMSILLSKTSQNERFQYRVLSRYNINGDDFWVNPNVNYTVFDAVQISGGMHLFSGKSSDPFYGHLNFGSFEKNTFTYLKLTAYW